MLAEREQLVVNKQLAAAKRVEEKRALRKHAQQRRANAIRRKVEVEQALLQSIDLGEEIARQTGEIQDEIVTATRQLRQARKKRFGARVAYWLRPAHMSILLPVFVAFAAGYVVSTKHSEMVAQMPQETAQSGSIQATTVHNVRTPEAIATTQSVGENGSLNLTMDAQLSVPPAAPGGAALAPGR